MSNFCAAYLTPSAAIHRRLIIITIPRAMPPCLVPIIVSTTATSIAMSYTRRKAVQWPRWPTVNGMLCRAAAALGLLGRLSWKFKFARDPRHKKLIPSSAPYPPPAQGCLPANRRRTSYQQTCSWQRAQKQRRRGKNSKKN